MFGDFLLYIFCIFLNLIITPTNKIIAQAQFDGKHGVWGTQKHAHFDFIYIYFDRVEWLFSNVLTVEKIIVIFCDFTEAA